MSPNTIMNNEYLKSRVRHFLAMKADALSGGDLNYNPGLLVGGRRQPGRPRKVGRPTKAAEKRAAIYALEHMGGGAHMRKPRASRVARAPVRRRGGAAHGNTDALMAWHDHLMRYRGMHPNMPYREAQAKAKLTFRR